MVWEPGQPVPRVSYTEQEDAIWRTVSAELHEKHERYAVREYLEAKERLGLPEDRVPQLDEVTARLEPLTGFRYDPAPGLVPLRGFYGSRAGPLLHSPPDAPPPVEPPV